MREGLLMPVVDKPAGPGLGRVLARVGQCVLTYLPIHVAAWVLVALVVPWGDSIAQIVRLGLGMLLVIRHSHAAPCDLRRVGPHTDGYHPFSDRYGCTCTGLLLAALGCQFS